ncbi:pentatricopeptide repeat-containing protein At1g31790 isoform X2 [Hevea brasiliensis]|uniref:pentatricopeptide repeat-containing protein At1g31790 isoform X2 n=1 Tax=Hevea brasiliensis TaxID=3981 RepID=UPI0025F76C3D|nr:pentatricopeptide repeat-containing protein At1g31790 isoform X2 [Hevea brasiliensis]
MVVMSPSTSTQLQSAEWCVHFCCSTKKTNKINPSNPSIDFKLRLRRPNPLHKPQILSQPIKISTTTRNYSRRKQSSCSDITRLMDSLSLPIPPDIYSSLIKECTLSCDSDEALQLHSRLIGQSGLELSSHLTHRLLLMLVSCGHLDTARNLFDQMTTSKDLLSWAIIIIGYLNNHRYEELCHHNTTVWTVKIVNNCREGRFHEVMKDFTEMGSAGIRSNNFTLSSVLRACARMDDGGNCGRQVHAVAIKLALESNTFVQCGLIDMYGKCGMVRDAKQVFEIITHKTNVAHWNAMLMAYVRNGLIIEAVKFLYHMEAAQVHINESLINHVRIACITPTSGKQN